MNIYGSERAEELANAEHSGVEYRNKLTRIHNMSILCHRSAEIDQGTLLYFSVNDMFLGDRDFFVLLFSEVSPPREESSAVRDVYGQVFTYAMIEEVVKECFTGHYTFYSCELDGRLVVIVCFLYGLAPGEADIHLLYPACERISKLCRERYDMDVVSYVSGAMDDVRSVSIIYHKLLNMATLHRYTEYRFPSPVISAAPPPMEDHSARPPIPLSESAKELANAIVTDGDYHAIADRTLSEISAFHANTIEDLNVRFGSFSDLMCAELRIRGVKLKEDKIRGEQFEILGKARYWREPSRWLHETLDAISKQRGNIQRQALLLKLNAAERYVSDNLGDPNLSVMQIGQAVGMNQSFIATAFRKQLDITPAAYIRKKRLERALELTEDGSYSVAQISSMCGFGSVETFHRVFKAEYGASPAKLRREIRK